jgi:uncharacterized protein YbjQ (UPF0145 family)
MSDDCGNCGAAITEVSTFKAQNLRLQAAYVHKANFINQTAAPEMCQKCGHPALTQANGTLDREIAERTAFLQQHITDFPMFTMTWLPANISVKLKNMVTANITVGTGLFNEMSQSWSDAFGAVSATGGMTGKVNKGEAAARAILVDKAMGMGANCLLAVDVDYGTTANNAATINMQATAALIANLDALLDEAELQRAKALQEAYLRIVQLRRWRAGHDIPAPGVSSTSA